MRDTSPFKRLYDASDRELRTQWAAQLRDRTVQNVRDMLTDCQRETRLGLHECLACYYLRRGSLAGQAFTEWRCHGCNATETHANTAVPYLCVPCATNHHACVRCGADIALRQAPREPPKAPRKAKRGRKGQG